MNKELIVMGINPGTRYLGLSVMDGLSLLDWRIKTFMGKWSGKKKEKIINAVRELIDYFKINKINIKKIGFSRMTKNLWQLIISIKKLARNKRIKVREYFIKEIEKSFIKGEKLNKYNLADKIINEYPVLIHEFKKEKTKKNHYYIRMMEAVALASIKS